MSMWSVLKISLVIISLCGIIYLGAKIAGMTTNTSSERPKTKVLIYGILTALLIFVPCLWYIGFMNTAIIMFHLIAFCSIADFLVWCTDKIRNTPCNHRYADIAAVSLCILYLLNGWYQAHHVWHTKYKLESTKLSQPLRIIQFADTHIGTTFTGKEFAKHIENMQQYKPDIVVITGDLIDNSTSLKDLQDFLQNLQKLNTQYGIYLVLGNHDTRSNKESLAEFDNEAMLNEVKKHGVEVLQDEVKLIDNRFYLIGRKDAYDFRRGGRRQNMETLLKNLDKNKYQIVLDHQPSDYASQEKSGVDLVLSGHTHGGQLFPINNVSLWWGLNDKIYGHEKRSQTDFIVTSGISDWELKFKTGCKSEFTIIDILPKGK